MRTTINELFYTKHTPEWAAYIAVTATGDCFWWKSKPYNNTSGVWDSEDGVHKKIPEVSLPDAAGLVVAKSPYDGEAEARHICPCCGQPINNQERSCINAVSNTHQDQRNQA